MTENSQKPNSSLPSASGSLGELRKKIIVRAVFSVVTLLLAAVLFFSLTAAWFTNVADTGGLTFSAAKWDFNGSVNVGEGAVSVAPGDSGIIPLQITNDGTETAMASVTVSKEALDDLMKKRLYFYVDTPFYRNSERMGRVYVTENGGYTYTVFGGSEISVTAEGQNAPALKWEWVYDVLGYYVRGRVTDEGALIDEYLRPIEYGYDPISTTFDGAGRLLTVDGEQTAEELLSALSATDGYEGEIDTGARTAQGYYPVSVNADGYGVWAYLCTYDEILTATEADTQLGSAAESTSYAVTVRVTGSNSQETALDIGNADMLLAVLNSMGNTSLRLTEDITVDGRLLLKSGYRTDIDLGGHTLTLTSSQPILVSEGAQLSLTNGKLSGGGNPYAIEAKGGEVTLSRVTVLDVTYGVKVSDHQSVGQADSRVHVVDSRIEAESVGVWVYGNGGEETSTTVIIERSTITGTNYAGITCNGTYAGTDVQIKDSTVRGYYTSIYHPQKDSTLSVENSTLEGLTGIVIKGGDVTLHDTVVRGTGTVGQITQPQYYKSGFSDTGDGIYLETNYNRSISVRVTGDNTVVTSANAYAVRKYAEDDTNAVISLSAGEYSTDVSAYLAAGAVQSAKDTGGYTVHITGTED